MSAKIPLSIQILLGLQIWLLKQESFVYINTDILTLINLNQELIT